MKILNNLLISAFLLTAGSVLAQTIYTDDFESYTTGQGIADQDGTGTWTTWSNNPGSAEDPLVTSEAAHGGTQAMVINGTNDGVLLLNDLTSNRYRIEFYLMVPENYVGYYNILQDFDGTSSTWGMQIYFKEGTGTIDGNGASAVEFTYTPGEWMKIQHFVDLDNDWIDFYINGEIIHAYQWSHGTFNEGTGINKLDAFNFYAWDDDGNGTPKYYMDDYIIEQVAIPNSPQNLAVEVQNANNVNITWDAPTDGTPDSYSVIRNGEEIAVVSSGNSYLDEGLYPGTYEYQVKAFYGESVGYSASPGTEDAFIAGGNDRSLVLFEIFTGTWCPYCPTAAQAVDMLADEGLDVAIIEYHGLNGDTYETPATATRSAYYVPFFDDGDGSLGYPTTVMNGEGAIEGALSTVADQNEYYDAWYDMLINKQTVYTITPTVDLVSSNPSVFDISLDVEETLNYYGEDQMRLFVALTETNIPENWQGGLTEVNFVLRDMLPDANGTVLDFSSELLLTETFQLTLDSEYVKDNCELVFFVQNMDNGEIMETKKVGLDTFVGITDTENTRISIYPNPTNGMVSIASSETMNEVSIYSITGQKVLQVNPENNLLQISTTDMANGVYSVKIKTTNNVSVQQIVVE